jgi:ubiquinone/menaquinone biosynthesis C-methylase UbiE
VDGALRDIHRVLKPGGTLAANVLLYPDGLPPLRGAARRIYDWGIKKGILYSPFQEHDIRQRLIAAGYEISREFKSGNTWNVVARKPAKPA